MSQAKFDKAVSIIQSLPKEGPIHPTTDEQLYFYQYYKQAKVGDNDTPKPGLLDFYGKAKWNARNDVKGTSKEEAMKKYVDKLIEVLSKVDNEDAKKYLAEIKGA